MQKLYLNEDVYTAFCKRMEFIFEEFDNIYVSFSGGKDSGTLLQLVFKYVEEHKITKPIGIFHQDFEAQYKKTTEFVERIFNQYEGFQSTDPARDQTIPLPLNCIGPASRCRCGLL